ncbi:arylsulfatase-like [Styela clava]
MRFRIFFSTFLLFYVFLVAKARDEKSTRPPNTIIFFADDLGYGDLNLYGNTEQESGAIEQMAQEGMMFTQWTSAAFICTPSRASLLTGRYARRTGVYGNSSLVFAPRDSGGLPDSERTIAEALKYQGYATGMVGKWHLGLNKESNTDGVHLPHNHGFDFVGTNLPLGQSGNCNINNAADDMVKSCFVYSGDTVVEQPINLPDLTQKLVDDAVKFIDANKAKPFFLYFAFPQVHMDYFCNSQFCGKSSRGEYGDNINEMSWAVGEVLNKIKTLEIEQDTIAIFTSDHGALPPLCRTTTSNGIFRSGKGTTWEGGYRVPAVLWWPGTIEPGTTSNNLVNHMDIFTTIINLAGQSISIK